MHEDRRRMGSRRALRMARAGGLALVLLAATRASAMDWDEVAGTNTVTITTTNEDGTPRETTIWLVVLDRDPYVRTGDTRWGANVERNPNVKLHVGDKDVLLTAVPVRDPSLVEKLQQAYRDKYGWSDAVVRFLPGAGTKLFRLEPQPGS